MAIQIQILNVTKETKPTAKGSYQVLDVAYKNLTFQGKVEGKKIMSFGATAESFKELANASSGDVYDIDVVKNDKGYNDWVAAKKSVGGAATSSNTASGTRSSASATNSPKSTYETPEERAKRQVLIVRQSSLANAVATLVAGSKSAPKSADVIELAKEYESYVFGDEQAKVDQPEKLPDDLNDDIPF